MTSHGPTREKADDSLPDREVPLAAEGVRSGPSPRWWCLNPNDHGQDLNPKVFTTANYVNGTHICMYIYIYIYIYT